MLNIAIDSIIAEGEQADIALELNGDPDAEEEEQGVTRCVCGNAGMLPPPLHPPVVLYDCYHLLESIPCPGRDSLRSQTSLGGVPSCLPKPALNPRSPTLWESLLPDRVKVSVSSS